MPDQPIDGKTTMRRTMLFSGMALLAGCGGSYNSKRRRGEPPLYPDEAPYLRSRINYWASHYDVPASLVHHMVIR